MDSIDRETARRLFEYYRKKRDGIRNSPEMASICLICGSVHILPKDDNHRKLYCRDCRFAFYRFTCPACGKTVDGRDPRNAGCGECSEPACTCGRCGCTQNQI